MDKDLIVLQKEINLHVADIKRIQGLMQRLALKKGLQQDELRRTKDKSRKTQAFLSQSKKVASSSTAKPDQTTSPERSMKQTMLSGQGSSGGSSAGGRGIVIDLLLFGPTAGGKKGMNMTQSFNNTISSSSASNNQVMPLKFMIRNLPIMKFEIATTNADGSRRTDTQMGGAEGGGKKSKKAEASLKGGKTNA